MKKVVLINNGNLPLPSVKGGAVESLIQLLIDENEKYNLLNLSVCCVYDEAAKLESLKYKHTSFYYHPNSNIVLDHLYKASGFINKRIGSPSWGDVYINAVIKTLVQIKPDVVVLEGCPGYAHIIKEKIPCVLICRYHNTPIKVLKKWDRMNYESTDAYWGISNYVSQEIKKIYSDFNKPIHTVYNAVDEDILSFSSTSVPIREKYNISSNDFVFIFTGRLQVYKGVRELLEAFKLLSQERSDVRLLVVGSNTFSDNTLTSFDLSCRKLVEDLGNRVIFTGFVPYSEIGSYYRAANVGVFPSMWEEPFALTCLESLVCGKPCIITRSGGMPEVVDNDCAMIVEKNTDVVKNLYSAMEKMYSNKAYYNNASSHASVRAQSFNKHKHFTQITELINQL